MVFNMDTTKIINDNTVITIIDSESIRISDVQSALDLIMNAKYASNSDYIAINKEAIDDNFFVLSSGLAGEILQKFINYHTKVAIYGDFSKYTSKPLKDFIYESNNGNSIFFVDTKEKAIKVLEEQS